MQVNKVNDYIVTSLEIHLFFARIMKEHALFLLASFPAKEAQYKMRADWHRQQLWQKIKLLN